MDNIRYEIAGGGAAGGFGAVTELRDRYLERSVILKSMLDPANAGQLRNEVIALVRARSRHIVEIYDFSYGADGQLEGIVIEHLTGRGYSDFYLEASLDAEVTTKVIYQLALALQDLHSVGIVHRDLKLDNFKSSSSGIVKLFDFGISGLVDPHVTVMNRGTYDYAAPELYTANPVITSAADVYAFGICCWKLVAENLPDVLTQRPPLQDGALISVAAVAPYLDEHVVAAIDGCLSASADARPSARQIAEQCERALLKNKHRGLFTNSKRNSKMYELSSAAPGVRIAIQGLGELRAAYSGNDFYVVEVVGDVYMNNKPMPPGTILLDACVITFGGFDKGASREYVSFHCSKPEVVL